MNVVARVKEMGVEFVVERLVALAARGARKDPDKTLRRMCRMAELITDDPAWKAAVQGVIRGWVWPAGSSPGSTPGCAHTWFGT